MRVLDSPSEIIRSPAESQVDEGLGASLAWGGLIDTLPFAIRSSEVHGAFAVEVRFPVRPGGDSLLLAALARLPLPRPSSVYFDVLCPGGFAVVRQGEGDPIYSSASRADAVAAARFLHQITRVDHVVVSQQPDPPRPLVIGPRSGPYLAWAEVYRDEATARRVAAAESERTGHAFVVAHDLAP